MSRKVCRYWALVTNKQATGQEGKEFSRLSMELASAVATCAVCYRLELTLGYPRWQRRWLGMCGLFDGPGIHLHTLEAHHLWLINGLDKQLAC